MTLATTYTTNLGLQKPAATDRHWDLPLNSNADFLDSLAPLAALAVTPTEYPSASLRVNVASGSFLAASGEVVAFGGLTNLTLSASSTQALWLSETGSIETGSSFPSGRHVRLAVVSTSASAVTQVVDSRVSFSALGQPVPYVEKAGDTITGAIQFASGSGSSPVLVVDPVNNLVGFFGATPVSQVSSIPALSSSAGTASSALVDVGSSYSQASLNNNFASLASQVNALIVTLKNYGLMGS